MDLHRFEGDRAHLPRCFIIHARLAPDIRKVIRRIKAALFDNFEVEADMDFGPEETARGRVLAALAEASFVICILDDLPPNVVFEYGYAKALKKPCLRMIRQGATASIFKHFLQDGQPSGPDKPMFDFDKHFNDARDLILRAYDPTDAEAPKKILVEELARPDQGGKTLGRFIIEFWVGLMRERLENSGDFQSLRDFISAKAKTIEPGKPLFGPLRRKRFSELLKQGFQRSPAGTGKRPARKGRELPDTAIAAVSSLPDKSRLALNRKFLRLKLYAQDCRLLFAECLTVLKVARTAEFKDALMNKEAEKLCKSFLRKWPETAQIHSHLGALLGQLNRLEEADQSFREALRIDANEAEAHFHYAVLLKNQKRLDEAEEHCKETLRIDPDHANACATYALVLEEQNRLSEAMEYYQEAFRINPNDSALHSNYAILAGKQKRLEESEEHYQEALRLNPANADAHYYYAIMLGEQDRLEAAEQHYQKGLRLKPDHAEMHNNYAAFLLRLDRLKEAEHHWQEALRVNPDYAQVHYNYAILLARQDRLTEAEAHYQAALRINPDDAEAHNDYGVFLMEQNQIESAEKHLQEAVRIRELASQASVERNDAVGGRLFFGIAPEG
jgi:tetratricopeptide (TPR) repeat protein